MQVINFTFLNKIDFYILFREFSFFVKSLQFYQMRIPGGIYFSDAAKSPTNLPTTYHKIYRTYKKMKFNFFNEDINFSR